MDSEREAEIVTLDAKELAFVKPYPPEQQLCALHWMQYLAREDVIFGTIVEKMKAKKAFFLAWEMANEAVEDNLQLDLPFRE